ncbi:DUF2382 domain-containing protein [Nocardia alba]|uniref:Uncharacterized protein (TIGR02271 family) n=1 Tax=Nocardia alba TaxID=225051 RepID=A0A4V6NCU2_9NOCA|nr:PRC and DUF2382 domain-containing protein [Nocardia alba]TCK00986.1 uncharacterized protein (TIGR02271 family) [Nocardia alba]
MTESTLESLIGAAAYDERGDKIGKVKQIYLDNHSGEPTWAAVSTGFFSHDSLVPLAGAEHLVDDDSIRLRVDKELVKSAPHHDGSRISAQAEQELFRHYHVDPRASGWNTEGSPRIRPGDDSPMTQGNRAFADQSDTVRYGDDSMVRSEEQLRVDTESEEVGTARLHKTVVNEEQTFTVPVTHEEVHIEREPIIDRTGRATISEEDREVVLHADQVHVEKETVPVERVRLAVDEVADEKTISETVRQERVEAEGVDDHRRQQP